MYGNVLESIKNVNAIFGTINRGDIKMRHPNNFRNVGTEPSPYFRGQHRSYGRYQWCIKYYGFQDEFEIEIARLWAFGEYSKGHLENLNVVVGRPVEASIEGRSGGWLVIDTELSDAELAKVDTHVKACLKGLPEFLNEERILKQSS
jgi:hypothetical protein